MPGTAPLLKDQPEPGLGAAATAGVCVNDNQLNTRKIDATAQSNTP
jgi:hypothetical protein